MPVPHGSVESVKSTIKSIEDNTQMTQAPEETGKQSITQDVKNTQMSGSGCLGGGNHKAWGSGK